MYSFPNLEPVHFSCPVLTVVSWPTYRFLRRQVRWSGITISRSSLRLTSIESVMPSSHLILGLPLLLLPPIPPSIKVFSNESTLRMRWPKYWSFSFSIIPSKEIPGLISFRMEWLILLAVQGPLKRSLVGYNPQGRRVRHDWSTSLCFALLYFTSLY